MVLLPCDNNSRAANRYSPLMNSIRRRRLELKLTQRQLASLCRVSQPQLSRYERGLTQGSEKKLNRVLQFLGLPPGPSTSRATIRDLVRRMRVAPPSFSRPRQEQSWKRVSQCYRSLLARLKMLSGLPAWFQDEAECDSAVEHVSVCILVSAGGELLRVSPARLGFWPHPLLDSHGKALGARPRPCVHWQIGELEILYWPQVSVRTASRDCRLDALVLCRKNGRKLWCAVEIDGKGHEAYQDQQRTRALDIPVLRFNEESVLKLNFAHDLVRELTALFEPLSQAA